MMPSDQRKGAVEFSLSTLVVLIMVLFLTMSSGGFITELEEALQRGYTNFDLIRVQQSVHQINDDGGKKVVLNLHNEYSVGLGGTDGNGIQFQAGFMDQPRGVVFPQRAIQIQLGPDVDAEDRGRLCLIKRGYEVQVNSMDSCSYDSCSFGTCDTFPTDGAANTRENVRTSDPDVPVDGYFCDNGVYTREDFHVRYRKHCEPETGGFVDLNRVSCPSRVFEGDEFLCNVKTTFNCTAGSTIEISASEPAITDKTKTRECTGDIQYAEVPIPLTIDDMAANYEINFSVSSDDDLAWIIDQNIRATP